MLQPVNIFTHHEDTKRTKKTVRFLAAVPELLIP